MHRALLELVVDGIETSREFHLRVMEDAEFRAGAIDIQWLERRLPSLLGTAAAEREMHDAAIAAALIADRDRRGTGSGAATRAAAAPVESAWAVLARRQALRD
jgi:acetyl-CoA carboxylase biotin carboxylase subunit